MKVRQQVKSKLNSKFVIFVVFIAINCSILISICGAENAQSPAETFTTKAREPAAIGSELNQPKHGKKGTGPIPKVGVKEAKKDCEDAKVPQKDLVKCIREKMR